LLTSFDFEKDGQSYSGLISGGEKRVPLFG
jgi:hypothetical protein